MPSNRFNSRSSSRSNTRNQTLFTGSSRKTRTSRIALEQEAAEEVRRAASLRLSERLGLSGPLGPITVPPDMISEEETTDSDETEETDDEPEDPDELNDASDSLMHDDYHNTHHDDNNIGAHSEYFRLQRYAERRDQISRQWNELNNQVVAAYLLCQKTTSNWTSPSNDFTLPPNTCTCPSNHLTERSVDLLDIIYRRPGQKLMFCKCIPDVVRLIHYGYFACSAECPRTAFSIRLVQYHHQLWQASAVSTSAFIQSLSSFLDSRSNTPMFNRGSDRKRRQLRVPFTHCIDLYSRILTAEKKLFEDGLQLTTVDKWANKCPRCFGSSKNEIKEDPAEPDFMIAMDGNFQQRHYAYASKDEPREDQYPSMFLSPSKIAVDMQAISTSEHQAVGINPPCSDTHKAANDSRNESTWEKCDDNGLFASTCRHDVPLMMVNIHKTGEKLYYPISIIRNLMLNFPQCKVGVLYDIGCHLEAHIDKRNLLRDRRSDIRFGTSVFHAYAHEWSCQVKYNPRFNEFWGLTDGEGLERFWSFLSPLVSSLRVSTRLHRLNAIHSRSDYFAEYLKATSAEWLVRKFNMAQESLRQTSDALQLLYSTNNPATPAINYTETFLDEQWALERHFHANFNQTRENQRKALGELLCLQDELDEAWERLTPTVAQAIARANTCSDIADQILRKRVAMGADQIIEDLTRDQSDLLWMVWHSKTELRQRFLALVEEKQPLFRVCRTGESTTLGTRGNQKLVLVVRKRAEKLQTCLAAYTKRAQAFIAACPHRHPPPVIEYAELLQLQPDDPFWNDGLFTNANDPWAIDINTQRGIRLLARFKRASEEKRRLGWETRRAMRWAITRHNQAWTFLRLLNGIVDESNVPDALQTILQHELLRSHRCFSAKVQSAIAITHSNLISISQLQVDWDVKIIEVLQKTAPQRGDNELLQSWKQQLTRITVSRRVGFLSAIPGDVHSSLLSHLPEDDELPQLDTDNPPPPPEDIDDSDLDADGVTDDGDDEELQEYFAQEMEAQMLRNLAQASNVG
ncbi:hypothetical protein PGT21_009222 [Puccinia graminis f. sp. tritici]|uniref:CxC1-like cysteine cluster associated with KDZ transposases domain-containing protein n=1 Tax=Puccinia graminis f. sp. tritici TaxID=56615 RepID=A0A5B0PTM1_PUCGR|nr:hypothetical protein PGT21_009222 [Puccinia graminis f. sp. tritici]KAA1128258.1 hypothetical protein PGTUg99_017761 [Puccinia graminis f. sp. tritici]